MNVSKCINKMIILYYFLHYLFIIHYRMSLTILQYRITNYNYTTIKLLLSLLLLYHNLNFNLIYKMLHFSMFRYQLLNIISIKFINESKQKDLKID